MDNDASDVINTDTVFRDEPCLKDLSELVDGTLSIVDSMLMSTNVRSIEFMKTVLLELMMVEKKCRSFRDGASNARICKCIIQLLYDIKDFSNLNYYLVLLSRKRGQLKATTIAFVNLAMSWIVGIDDMETKMNLINTLNYITLGKMFLESQRAELAFTLAKIKVNEGKIDEAANILHSVEVETFSSLTKRAKVDYILEQMYLHLLNKDYLRFYITSNKINADLLDREEYGDARTRYYGYMVQYYLHQVEYFDIARAYHQRMRAAVRKDNDDWIREMECMLLFLMISPISEESVKFSKHLIETEEKRIEAAPLLAQLFKELLSDNLITLPLHESIAEALKGHVVFSDDKLPGGQERLDMLTDRIIQHNILVASKFYTVIKLQRLAELINTTSEKVEMEVSTMVHTKTIHAKINRPEGVIKFGEHKEPDILLNKWANDIAMLMGQVDQCARLVQKEKMIHEARLKKIELEKAIHS